MDRIDFQATFNGYEPIPKHASLSKLGEDNVDRWTKIKAGELPDDDDTPRPRTDDQLDEEMTEALRAIEQASRSEQDTIREGAEERESELLRRADRLEDEAAEMMRDDPEEAQRLRRQAEDAEEEATEITQDAEREWQRVAARNEEQTAEIRSRMRREHNAEVEQYNERVAELRDGLNDEIAKAINEKYFDEVEDWVEITDIEF